MGLDLDKDDLSGTYVAFGGGTGVFCFLDFVAFTLRYVCYKIASTNFNQHDNIINKEDFSMVKDDFRLIYFSTFQDEESVVYHDMCDKLQKLDKKYNLNVFKFISRVSSKDKERWDTVFVNEKLEKIDKVKKAFICGPVRFLNDMKAILLQTGKISEDKIHLV